MDPEIKELLRRNIKLTEENNAILRKMHRSAMWSSFFRFVYWLLIIAAAVASFYYTQPYLDKALQLYNQVQATTNQVKSITNFGQQ